MAAGNSNRDRQSQGKVTSLVVQPGGYGGSMSYGGGSGIGNGWFGPLAPMNPTAPPSVKGRIFDYQSGYNLNTGPRPLEPITFQMLRNFSDSYDILRLLIERRKDQMARLRWNIQPRDRSKIAKVRVPGQKGAIVADTDKDPNKIQPIKDFLLRPDKKRFWGPWLRMLLEDLMVLDAPSIFRRRTNGGDLYALQPIDGATIKRVIDDFGNTPEPPLPAYQQILKGYPAVDYTTDDLIYAPRNQRTHKIFGYSPVEQMIMTINIGLRRETWQLQSLTEGNIPEALIGVPDNWTPDQIRVMQDWFDSALQGNTANRRRAWFIPGGMNYTPTKDAELFGAGEEWLVRVMCFAFGLSPQPFIKMVNRATAETAQQEAAEEGLAPLQEWVKEVIDSILIDDFNRPDLEFEWEEDEELDPATKQKIVSANVEVGLATLNEGRMAFGQDPIEDCPEADRPMVLTPTGYVPFALTEDEKAQQADEAQQQADQQHQQTIEQIKAKGAAGVTDKPGEEDGTEPPKPGGAKPPAAKAGEVAQKGDVPFTVSGAGSAGELSKRDLPPHSDPLRPFCAEREAKLAEKLRQALAAARAKVVEQVKAKLERLGKADGDGEDRIEGETSWDEMGWTDGDLDALMDELDLDAIYTTQDDFDKYLGDVAGDSAERALAQMGGYEQLTDQVNDRAVAWARDNAATLVSLEDDPTADAYSLMRSTRVMVRDTIASGMAENKSTSEIGDALEQSYAFSEDRADLIAATEITSANSMGALQSYEEAKSAGVDVQKSWLVLEDGCQICQDNADAGAIPLDEPFPSGDMAPGAHPHCRCVLVPEVQGQEADEGSDDAVEEVAAEGDPTDD